MDAAYQDGVLASLCIQDPMSRVVVPPARAMLKRMPRPPGSADGMMW
jgi:hypothetical protein